MSIITEFMDVYTKKHDFYREAARVCAQVCETNMEQMGIRAIVTSRAKKPDRLQEKLEKRELEKNYASSQDIVEDIADLSGVRIALYFPGDLYKVRQLIDSAFHVKECRVFPDALHEQNEPEIEYQKRFSGYWATHFRVYMKENDLPEEAKKYSRTLIEIQVASALMHAWAEVEHDLLYKPYSGDLSYEEYQILDELNGLVLAGEIALQRLQKAMKIRVSEVGKEFNNHYELAMFLYNKLGSLTTSTHGEIGLGRVDLLYQCIKSSGFNKPEKLKGFIAYIDPNIKNRSVVDQLIDKISELEPELYDKYKVAKQSEELKYQLEALQINRDNGNRQGEANTLANIGYIYSSKENYEEAIHYFTKALKINHEIGGIQGEANQLLNLGSTYRLKGDLDQALEYCNKAIQLHRQINYKQGQANTLGMMGSIYLSKGNLDTAWAYYVEALGIYKETDYKIGVIIQLNNLGILHEKKMDKEQALEYFNQALEICLSCEYKQGEGDALQHIGSLYLEMGNSEKAIDYYEKALSIQEGAGNHRSQIGILMCLGKAYITEEKVSEALHYYREAYALSNDIEFKLGAVEALDQINSLQKYAR
ncbi:MAG: hypothetical protein K0S47_4138 [Herbinix sp.]|jgi:tetratricopeptide (TPR) repeat protein|nr:hypothetical protein [Herbinix sp.]